MSIRRGLDLKVMKAMSLSDEITGIKGYMCDSLGPFFLQYSLEDSPKHVCFNRDLC